MLKPEILVFTNVSRDQPDRYGKVTHTLLELETAAKAAPEAVLCLNADDSLIASLSLGCANPVRFYGVGVPLPREADERSDAPNCVRCGRRSKKSVPAALAAICVNDYSPGLSGE